MTTDELPASNSLGVGKSKPSRLRRVPARIMLDIDETFEAAHGGQQLALFNGHYRELGYQPIVIFGESDRPLLARLRPGKRPTGNAAADILNKTLEKLGAHWPKTSFMYRGGVHYGVSDVLNITGRHGCSFVFGLAANPWLNRLVQPFPPRDLERGVRRRK